jgi:hypothetical protein
MKMGQVSVNHGAPQERAIKRRIKTEKRLKAHVTIFNLSADVIITPCPSLF